jgi:hypothetical protein
MNGNVGSTVVPVRVRGFTGGGTWRGPGGWLRLGKAGGGGGLWP